MTLKYVLPCHCELFEWKFCLKVENFGWCLTVTLDVNKTAGGWEFPVSELVDMLVSVVRFRRHNAALGRNLTSVSRSQAALTTPMMEKTHKVKLEPFLSVIGMQSRCRLDLPMPSLRCHRSFRTPSLKPTMTTSLLLQVRLFRRIVSRLLSPL